MWAEEDKWITLFVSSFTVKVPLYKVVNLHWHCGAYGRSGMPPTCVYRDIQINSSEIQPNKIDWAGVHRQWPKLQKSNTWFLKVKKQSTLQSASTSLTEHALKLKVDTNHTEDRCSEGLVKHFKRVKPFLGDVANSVVSIWCEPCYEQLCAVCMVIVLGYMRWIPVSVSDACWRITMVMPTPTLGWVEGSSI